MSLPLADDDHDEWVRRARISNVRYMEAMMRFVRDQSAPKPKKPQSTFVPGAIGVIMGAVCDERGLTVRQIQGRSRKAHLVSARRCIALRAREIGCSYPQIGRALHRDHTTIMHHVGALAA